jgi:hypothetical protein
MDLLDPGADPSVSRATTCRNGEADAAAVPEPIPTLDVTFRLERVGQPAGVALVEPERRCQVPHTKPPRSLDCLQGVALVWSNVPVTGPVAVPELVYPE